tara:strand:- start:418 stop:798 length:381 start_codon:yes stop_codon:yes gene_type:complete
MATNADWTVIFDDKVIIKRTGSDQGSYIISNDDSFWSQDKWSNIWAIQYKDDNHDYNDSVEHRDETPHATWAASELGDFNSQFISRWDAAHLAKIQSNWDNDNAEDETEAEKIARLGERPTSYSSS